MSGGFSKRLGRELLDLNKNTYEGIKIVQSDDFKKWLIDLQVIEDNPIYNGKVFRLQFEFPSTYPIDSPTVKFIKTFDREIPMHPHIYSNGHICLNVLGNEWSPVQTVASVTMSIQSMLSDNKRNDRPPGDARYVAHAPDNPRNVRFEYHDDTV
ncbi:ubiquitin-conjugating enzyme/RWD-like protein [Lipomyces oligophaga]|uniref:ubiquitin-conjugating enzyme/RWD-like protein n=1 Tax=Lipomyces oligophaga TaxID=45792 RepID=UPI0034CDCAFB